MEDIPGHHLESSGKLQLLDRLLQRFCYAGKRALLLSVMPKVCLVSRAGTSLDGNTHVSIHLCSLPCPRGSLSVVSSSLEQAHVLTAMAVSTLKPSVLCQVSPVRTMRFGSTAKVLLKCKLKYYRISECVRCPERAQLLWQCSCQH